MRQAIKTYYAAVREYDEMVEDPCSVWDEEKALRTEMTKAKMKTYLYLKAAYKKSVNYVLYCIDIGHEWKDIKSFLPPACMTKKEV